MAIFVTHADIEAGAAVEAGLPTPAPSRWGTILCTVVLAALLLAFFLYAGCSAHLEYKYAADKYLPVYSFEPLPVHVSYFTSRGSPSRRHPYQLHLNATVKVDNPARAVGHRCGGATGTITYADDGNVAGDIGIGGVDVGPGGSMELSVAGRLYAYDPLGSSGGSAGVGGDGEETFGVSFDVPALTSVGWTGRTTIGCFNVDCRVALNKVALEGARVVSSSCRSRRYPNGLGTLGVCFKDILV